MESGVDSYLGLDQGKSTGAAWLVNDEIQWSTVVEDGFDGFLDWWRRNNPDPSLIICERYVPLEGFRGKDQTHSLKIEGAVQAMSECNVVLQTRSDKATLFKQTFTGDKGEKERREWLRERGLFFATDHEMDAATHILVNRKRAKDMRFWKRYWA